MQIMTKNVGVTFGAPCTYVLSINDRNGGNEEKIAYEKPDT